MPLYKALCYDRALLELTNSVTWLFPTRILMRRKLVAQKNGTSASMTGESMSFRKWSSRNPIWPDTDIQTNVSDMGTRYGIDKPDRKLMGFNLPRREWKFLNRFRSGLGCCALVIATMVLTSLMSHILNYCPLRRG